MEDVLDTLDGAIIGGLDMTAQEQKALEDRQMQYMQKLGDALRRTTAMVGEVYNE
jgi:hypothetical protein